MSLNISSKLKLPLHAALWTYAILAIKGAGKTASACVLAEEMIKNKIPIIALDPMGIWWGLRVGAHEGEPGLPIVIFGGAHQDLEIPTKIDKKAGGRPMIDEDRVKLMVKSILESGISAVVDTSELSKRMQRRTAAIVLEELYTLNAKYGVRHVFVEESDTIGPQRATGETAASLGALDDVVRRGGNFNLGCTMITQRSAVLNKDVLTQANCLLAMRILAKLDKQAVMGWVETMAHTDPVKLRKWYDSLENLENGEAWIWNPEAKLELTRIRFRRRETLHASREYFRQEAWEQKNIRLMDVGDFVAKFQNVFKPKQVVAEKGGLAERPVTSFQLRTSAPTIVQRPLVLPPKPEERRESRYGDVRETDLRDQLSRPLAPQTSVGDSVTLQQSLPSIILEQMKPNLHIPVELLQQPTTPLGKVIVVLKNNSLTPGAHNDHWSITKIKTHIRDHGWDENGVDEAVQQLFRWEILLKQSNGQLRFVPSRVQFVEREQVLEVS